MKTLEIMMDNKTSNGGASVCEAKAAVDSLTKEEKALLLVMMKELHPENF